MSDAKELLHTNPRLKELGDRHRAANEAEIKSLAATLAVGAKSFIELAAMANMPPEIAEIAGSAGLTTETIIAQGVQSIIKDTLHGAAKLRMVANLPDAAYPALVRSLCELIITGAGRADELHAALREEQGTPRAPMQ